MLIDSRFSLVHINNFIKKYQKPKEVSQADDLKTVQKVFA